MTKNEKIAKENIEGIFNHNVGEWINCIYDDCEEYIPDTLENAIEYIYEDSMENKAREGYYGCGKAPREMRFAGTEFIVETIRQLFITDEDVKYVAETKGWNLSRLEKGRLKWELR